MLLMALIGSTILIGIPWLWARGGGPWRYGMAATVSLVAALFTLACLQFPLMALNALLIAIIALACLALGAKPRRFLQGALAATAASYAVVIASWTVPYLLKARQLRAAYPLESLADRLAYESKHASPGTHSAQTLASEPSPRQPAQLDELDYIEEELRYNEIFTIPRGYRAEDRSRSLAEIHKSYVAQFINSPGFGLGRMLRQPDHGYIPLEDTGPVPLPPPISEDRSAAGENDDPSPLPRKAAHRAFLTEFGDQLWDLHEISYFHFINVIGFGYVADREHVAGFQPHQSDAMILYMPGKPWELRSVDLVSLLKYPEPVAYVSANLPRMQELRNAPTRRLGGFESKALAALRRGEDLQVHMGPERIRMLGSIRAVQPCLKCHEVEHGDLLGAFSYRLRKGKDTPADAR